MLQKLKNEIEQVTTSNFEELALKIFRFQILNCAVYSTYVKNLGLDFFKINSIEKIPFLPIGFFKKHKVLRVRASIQSVFESSGTTSQIASKHYVSDLNFYKKISASIFEKNYGGLDNYHIIALLPSYMERGNSSLVFMVKHFCELSNSPFSGFYLSEYEEVNKIFDKIISDKKDKRKILLWGVTYALLELVERNFNFADIANRLIVLETGGMKGRRREMIKEELYDQLREGFSVQNIHSEYGMTELLSQAYSNNDGLFRTPNTMRIVLREVNDPFSFIPENSQRSGGINIIDLANVDSCSFIETQDLGQFTDQNGGFKVLGRFDNSDLRGCNLLVS
jgi:Acyl-protein synthetase, LuxE